MNPACPVFSRSAIDPRPLFHAPNPHPSTHPTKTTNIRTCSIVYLTSAQVAETANELGLVKTVRSHLHASHNDHALVHIDELLLGDVNLKRRNIAVVGLEGFLVKVNGDVVAGYSGGGKSADILTTMSR